MRQTLAQLGQQWDDRRCVYCGAPSTDFDHFQAIVRARRPSGYLNEAKNLVPACGTCNQSKGSRDWHGWMIGRAKKCPLQRDILDLEERISVLKSFAAWADHQPGNIVDHVDPKLWESYWGKLDQIERLMLDAQAEADLVREQIVQGMAAETKPQ
jgi:HNH endonuclease